MSQTPAIDAVPLHCLAALPPLDLDPAVCPPADGSELESVAPASMVNVVARLEAFAGMSRMKRLALVVLCHTVTDRHMTRLKVGASVHASK